MQEICGSCPSFMYRLSVFSGEMAVDCDAEHILRCPTVLWYDRTVQMWKEVDDMKKTYGYRGAFYLLGLLVLALGITLNTKVGLGVSPIISVSYSISTIWRFDFGNTTLAQYVVFIAVEMVLHIVWFCRYRRRTDDGLRHAERCNLKLVLLLDVLQFPLSLVFTRFLNGFSACIPNFAADCAGQFAGSFAGRFLILLSAIALTGIGAALSLNVRLVPNPGDGIVQAIADCIGKRVGFTKNCFDVCNILTTIAVSLIFEEHLVGIGLGTVVAVVGVGRVIAVFNRFCWGHMAKLAGLPQT